MRRSRQKQANIVSKKPVNQRSYAALAARSIKIQARTRKARTMFGLCCVLRVISAAIVHCIRRYQVICHEFFASTGLVALLTQKISDTSLDSCYRVVATERLLFIPSLDNLLGRGRSIWKRRRRSQLCSIRQRRLYVCILRLKEVRSD